ncbi:MAG: hypothetical protein UX99_C0003G0059 [Candidatus Amesbacteria bacterium GW2011_GWB1_47_26]|uniref:Gamma-glutamylcyclotransferase AIG2-like domain-containing protein n=1 Tax=Candidatus Amesbacteria bacterium GW2011_GWC2_45_19 TaxID=1618366 RepID=A0A0G1Q3G2_9BACT|nr:MAG: hypothetical protein UX05_C0003G0059 [Candidatus Amesbacteria bacterium GW2011_GWC2_45_19]KKU38679.1 MAG: hypothetical protein UX52_C0002G0059 [Candidatus Amesbacteria bacterium GW2011_GWA1_46_35]KKU68617.1 MAG: hypothetical protein UX93_C0006G0034 [Microgenomates group bacterium GW2011_GWC1_47_20]KKU74999.1 MAG: hypothetical protein UX99_C0003G0059 [Candidatus Amesbacteria bacterium GW2011_GWB1_47_26]KKU79794.1 MAG: hypothetical protein UY06_C0013G0008 [Candidatus Amesbacteria bacteriu
MDICQTKCRVGNFKIIGKATLNGFALKFNKKSVDGSGKANIEIAKNSIVEGVVFELTEDKFELLDCFEKGYHRSKPINTLIDGKVTEVVTYLADSNRINNNLLPTVCYLNIIIEAAEMIGLSNSYQKNLKSFRAKKDR